MKKCLLLSLLITFLLISLSTKSQSIIRANEIKKLDSLISLNLNTEKIDAIGRTNRLELKSRGINPCEDDYDNVLTLFKSLKSNYISCCNGNTNYPAVARILTSIYSIIKNPNCKWGASQWLVFGYYLNDYASFVDKNNCCK